MGWFALYLYGSSVKPWTVVKNGNLKNRTKATFKIACDTGILKGPTVRNLRVYFGKFSA